MPDINIRIQALLDQATSTKNISNQIKQIQQEINRTPLQLRIESATGVTRGITGQITQTNSALADLFARVDAGDRSFSRLEARTIGLNRGMSGLGTAFSRLTTTMTHNIAKMAEWAVAGTLIFGTLRSIGDGIQFISDLDDALNQIRVVTGTTQVQVDELGRQYNELAKELSVTTQEIAQMSVTFFRQGLAQEEVNKRMEDTIKLAQITGLTFNQTAEIITATANSMEIDSRRIADVFSFVGKLLPLYTVTYNRKVGFYRENSNYRWTIPRIRLLNI